MPVLIGVDIGTSKVCAAAFDARGGACVGVRRAPTPSPVGAAETGAVELDAEEVVSRAVELAADLVADLGDRARAVAGLGATGQMHGVVLADAQARPRTRLVTWQDRRGEDACPATGRTWAGELAARLGRRALARAGCAPASGYGGATLLRLAEGGLLPEGATALTIQDLFVARLTGALCTDPTDAAGWALFDAAGGRWLAEAGAALGLASQAAERLLPRVLDTGGRAGVLTPEAARAIGLARGLPVAVALGDSQAAFLGAAPALDACAHVNLGTGGQVCVSVDGFVRAEGLETRPLVAGRWALVGASLCGGRALDVLAGLFADVARALCGEPDLADLYARLDRLACAAPADAKGLRASTTFAGTRAEPEARGAVTGIGTDNWTAANLARAVVEGMVGELAELYERARGAGARVERLSGAGGALRRSRAVREAVARRFGLIPRLTRHTEEAAAGAALAAGRAAGMYASWDEAMQAFRSASG